MHSIKKKKKNRDSFKINLFYKLIAFNLFVENKTKKINILSKIRAIEFGFFLVRSLYLRI